MSWMRYIRLRLFCADFFCNLYHRYGYCGNLRQPAGQGSKQADSCKYLRFGRRLQRRVAKIYLQLAELFVQPAVVKQNKRYNILGASPLHYRAESDICEIESLLREAFGYELLHCFAMNTTTEAIAELGSAELNIILAAEALPCAEYLQSVTGTPYVYLPPYGYSQTTEFLNSVAAVIGQPVKEAMLQRLAEKNRRLKMLLNSPLLSRTPGTVF